MNKKEKELLKVIYRDVTLMDSYKNEEDYKYYFALVKGNLKDLIRGC